MVLEKILSKRFIFIIGDKHTILDFIEDFELEAEPLQINGDNMMSLKITTTKCCQMKEDFNIHIL
jgi:hypothetical protein